MTPNEMRPAAGDTAGRGAVVIPLQEPPQDTPADAGIQRDRAPLPRYADRSDIASSAAALIRAGFRVVPLRPRSTDFYAGSPSDMCASTEDEVDDRLARFGNANLGVYRAPILILAASDPDAIAYLQELEMLDELPPSWRQVSPDGGVILWFRAKPRSPRITFQLDRGLHGAIRPIVVPIPPSELEGGALAWSLAPGDLPLADCPEWLWIRAAAARCRDATPDWRDNDAELFQHDLTEAWTLVATSPDLARAELALERAADLLAVKVVSQALGKGMAVALLEEALFPFAAEGDAPGLAWDALERAMPKALANEEGAE